MCPCRTFRSEPRTAGVRPAQEASLRAAGNRLMSPVSATRTSAVNSPDPGQRPEHLYPRVGLGVGVQVPVEPVDQSCQGADDRQAAGDDLPRRRRQARLGQPAAARPGPDAGGPVRAVAGGDGVDPVAQLGAEPDQADPVPDQGAEPADPRRGEPRLGQQVRAQQPRQDGGAGPCRSSAGPRRSPCTAAGAPGAPRSRSPPADQPASSSRTRPRTPPYWSFGAQGGARLGAGSGLRRRMCPRRCPPDTGSNDLDRCYSCRSASG